MASEVAEVVGEVAEGHVVLGAVVVGGPDQDELPQVGEVVNSQLQEDLLEEPILLRVGSAVYEHEGIVLLWPRSHYSYLRLKNFMKYMVSLCKLSALAFCRAPK